MLVDSHCHLDCLQLREDVEGVVARAAAAGVGRMVSICTRPSRFDQTRRIAEGHASVLFAAGLHPCHVGEEPAPSVEDLVELAAHPRMVGIGETGMDFFRRRENAPQQEESLRIHIEAARQTGLPLIVHARAADDALARVLEAEFRSGAFACVMHCFASGEALARTALSCGFYLSMSGIVTFRSGEPVRDIFREVPMDRVLVETDSPFLAPEPHRSRRNEPALLPHIARVGARLKHLDVDEFAVRTTENFFRLFRSAHAADAD